MGWRESVRVMTFGSNNLARNCKDLNSTGRGWGKYFFGAQVY